MSLHSVVTQRVIFFLLCVNAAVIFVSPASLFAQTKQSSVDDLLAVVNGEDSIKCAKAITEIGNLKPASDLAIQALVDRLADDRRAVDIPDYVAITFPVDTVGSTAMEALAKIGKPAVSRICELLNSNDNPNVRELAIRSLAKMAGDAAEALPILERMLRNPEAEIRYAAVEALVSVQKDPRALSSVLSAVLYDKSSDVRAVAIRALGDLGEFGSENAPRLLELLDDTENRWHFYTPDMVGTRPIRYDSAMALASMGKDARVALARLKELMKDDTDSLVGVAAAFAIAKIDNAPKNAMDYLIAAVQESGRGHSVPEAAAEALGKLGPTAKVALPALDVALKHRETMVRIQAVESIVSISPDTAASRLLKMLDDKDALVRASTVRSLGSLANPSTQLISAYIAALDDTDPIDGYEVRHAAAVALGNLQSKSVTAVPRLSRLAQEETNDAVKDAALKAIEQITGGQTASDRSKP